MKKFTKGCLTTALVLFLVGLILCLVCGLLGGFRQLSEMNGIGWIPFRYARNAIDSVEPDFLRDNDIGEVKAVLEEKLKELDGEKEQLPLTADTLGNLDIDVEGCNVLIQRSDDAHVWLLVEGDSHDYEPPHYAMENDGVKSTLCIENEVKHSINHWKNGPNNTNLYLWLPDGCALEECEIDIGAGVMESIFIKAKKVKVSAGAAALDLDGFEGEEILLSADAGEILARRVTAEKAVLQIGAGNLCIEEISVSRKADVDVSAGNCEIAGTITGDLDLECDIGYSEIRLTGSEDDHSYEVECGMGDVTVGSYSHGGFATEKSWNEGKNSQFDIDCGMGNVVITFDK